MTGPGGREAGRVSIRVLPDTSVFARSLKRYLERVEKTLRVQIPTQLDDSKALTQAKALKEKIESKGLSLSIDADTKAVEAQISKAARDRRATINVGVSKTQLKRVAKQVTSALVGLTKITVVGAAVASALVAAAQAAGGLAVAVGAAAGAVAAMGPAVLLAAGAVAGTLVLAFKGLADSAVPAVKEMRAALESIRAPVKALQEATRASLFAGLGAEIRKLAGALLPVLQARIRGIAASLNQMAKQFSGALRSAQSVSDTNKGLLFLQQGLRAAAAAVAPLVRAFRDIAVVGAAFLPGMGEGFANLAQRFAAFIAKARESGQLKEFFESGFEALSKLADILQDVGGIIKSVFRALETAGGTALGVLGSVLDQVNAFLSSAEGQTAMVSLFTSIKVIGQALAPIFVAAATAIGKLAPVVAKLIDAIGPGVQVVITALADALKAAEPGIVAFGKAIAIGLSALAPSLQPLAEAFSAILRALAPLLPTLGELAAVFAGALASVLTAIAPALRTVAETLATVLAPILPLLAKHFAKLAEAMAPVAQALGEAIVIALQALAPILPQIVEAFSGLALAFAKLLAAVAPALPPLVQMMTVVFTKAVIPIILGIVDGLTWFVNVLTDIVKASSGPISAVLTFIGKLTDLRTLVPTVASAVGRAWQAVTAATSSAWSSVTRWISDAWESVKSTVRNATISVAIALYNKWAEIKSAVKSAWDTVWNTIKAAWEKIKTGVSEGVAKAVDEVKKLPGKAVSALKGIGTKLLNSGKALIQGFITGIRRKIGDVVSAVKAAVDAARQYFPFSPAKKGPFSGKGWTLYSGRSLAEGFADGMRDRATLVKSAASQLVSAAAPGLSGKLAGASVQTVGVGGAGFGGDQYIFNGRDIDINERTVGPVIHGMRTRARVGKVR